MPRKPQTKNSIPLKLYNTEEVARMLRVAPNTLKIMRKAGTGPRPIRLGPRSIFYRMGSIEEYLTALEATGRYEWSHQTAKYDDE